MMRSTASTCHPAPHLERLAAYRRDAAVPADDRGVDSSWPPTMRGRIRTLSTPRSSGGKPAASRGKRPRRSRWALGVAGRGGRLIHIDEDPAYDLELYEECQARLTTTNGIIICSMSRFSDHAAAQHFKNKSPGTAEILMTVWDAAYRSAPYPG